MKLHNFSAGPAVIPEPVLLKAQQALVDWQGTGVSILSTSHRSEAFQAMAEQMEQRLRQLLSVPDHYRVLFLHGGATLQFAAVPLNLLGKRSKADYVNTGHWSQIAINEAQRYADVQIVANGYEAAMAKHWAIRRDAAYVHCVANETIDGVEIHQFPDTAAVPLVADMSSSILAHPIDIERFGVIYAGAQKNIGPAGLVVAVVREDLLDRAKPETPTIMQYGTNAERHSAYNTPTTFSWYLANEVFAWLLEQGGVEAMATQNRCKAETLYAYIDSTDFYHNPVPVACRSQMNVPFTIGDAALEAIFIRESVERGLLALKGHRLIGGMRASLYNAMTLEGVNALIDFMKEFEQRYG